MPNPKNLKVNTILQAATQAPSGDNAQPWRFVVEEVGDEIRIDVYVVAERDQSLYSWGNRASFVAVGAAIENLHIAAAQFGFRTHIHLLPTNDNQLYAARITLTEGEESYGSGLFEYVSRRVSNRKPYDGKPLSKEEIDILTQASAEVGHGFVKCIDDKKRKKMLGTLGSYNERIMLGNKLMHKFFFDHINWTKKEDDKKKVGFFIDTLELPMPVKLVFLVIKNWTILNILNRVLLFNIAASISNARLYSHSSAFMLIVMPSNTAKDAVCAGMVLERVWLTAAKLGLSAQPVAGMIYLAMRSREGVHDGFSEQDLHLLNTYSSRLNEVFDLHDNEPFFILRVGHSSPASAQASRFALEEVVAFK